MMFTIEFFRIRKEDNARAMLDRITHIATDLESAKVKAKSLFETLNMPQNPDGFRVLDQNGQEVVLLDAKDGGFLKTRMVRIAALIIIILTSQVCASHPANFRPVTHCVRGFFPCD